jgi:alpha-L-fucosidase
VVRDLAPDAVIFGMGPDVRWVGTESGYGRETEWSVVPVSIRNGTNIPDRPDAAWIDDHFLPGDMMALDLGSRLQFKPGALLLWYPSEADVSIRPGWFYHEAQDTQVKTPETLKDIYYASVGRNSVLLLNVPPDRRGRIHENDTASLLGMRKILDRTFARNLAADAKIKAENQGPGNGAKAVLDSDASTFWYAAEGTASSWLEFEFDAPVTFDVAMIQEPIAMGQRVEKFHLEIPGKTGWEVLVQGTTIGYKRLLRFGATTTKTIRLVIEQSRSHPMISEFGLFRQPPAEEKTH